MNIISQVNKKDVSHAVVEVLFAQGPDGRLYFDPSLYNLIVDDDIHIHNDFDIQAMSNFDPKKGSLSEFNQNLSTFKKELGIRSASHFRIESTRIPGLVFEYHESKSKNISQSGTQFQGSYAGKFTFGPMFQEIIESLYYSTGRRFSYEGVEYNASHYPSITEPIFSLIDRWVNPDTFLNSFGHSHAISELLSFAAFLYTGTIFIGMIEGTGPRNPLKKPNVFLADDKRNQTWYKKQVKKLDTYRDDPEIEEVISQNIRELPTTTADLSEWRNDDFSDDFRVHDRYRDIWY